MINVGRDLADAVKERTPKRFFLPEELSSGRTGNTRPTVAGVFPRCAIEYLFSVFREIAIFNSIAIFCY